MKKLSVLTFVIVAVIVLVSCDDVKRTPGRDYMPDMRYSRAYETYKSLGNFEEKGINYNASPVPGTVKRGEVYPFPFPKDRDGDSVYYVASRQVVNPLAQMNGDQYKEAERLYLINCAICHGTALDGNGPLWNGGNGPYPAAPRNLIADPHVSEMPEGQLFYSVTYGKGQMGPYGPQLTTSQRWRIVHYVKMKQLAAKGGGTTIEGGVSTMSNPAAAGGSQPNTGANAQKPENTDPSSLNNDNK